MKTHYTNEKDYPQWCCIDCGLMAYEATFKRKMSEGGCATFHMGECGSCHKHKSVTQPRDYRYPNFKLL